MSRVKRGVTKLKSRRNTLSQVKGYRFARSKKKRTAYEAIFHAGSHAFRHRRAKKREFRNLWTLRINAASRTAGISYSKFIGALKKKNIALDRKSLSSLAKDHPSIFARVAEVVVK